MKWPSILMTANLVLLMAVLGFLVQQYRSDRLPVSSQAVAVQPSEALLDSVEKQIQASVREALDEQTVGASKAISTDEITRVIIEKIDEVEADREARMQEVFETANRVVAVSAPVSSLAPLQTPVTELAALEVVSAPAVSAIPPEERLRLVHFRVDSAELTPGGQRKTMEAVEQILARQPGTIRIAGFTDTTGSPEYNLKLSSRRAQAVADMLVSAGIDKDRIEVVGLGGKVFPEPTADNIDEPLNRCVSITAIR